MASTLYLEKDLKTMPNYSVLKQFLSVTEKEMWLLMAQSIDKS